ncbi:MAG TPA: TIGR03088 family PEP-CTERM/XrtA system glycosyltransferase [Chromatiales bacterium]|nr:TIGR03088 family PEP-CTERM/XrtA system glycosyltransferase [Chromatiales bacterium]
MCAMIIEDCPISRIHVCHIIFRLDYGGLENGLVNLINHLPRGYYQHSIICLKGASDFRARITAPDVMIYDLKKKDGKDIGAYFRLYTLIRKLRPNIVHTRNIPTIDMLLPARLASRCQLIHSEHGLDINELDGRHHKYNLLRKSSRLIVDQYISMSHDLAEWLNQEIGIPRNKISIIYNGVDTNHFSPGKDRTPELPIDFLPKDHFVIGTIGRLEPVKDQITLVKAFIHILQARPKLRATVRLIIGGDGSLKKQIESMLAEAGVSELAWLPGFYSDTAALYRICSIFALPSKREGISNTILEAMASGLPVVATNVGGTPEIVTDGTTGKLVSANNPAEMAEAILCYIDDPALRHQHARQARQSAEEKYSLNAMINGYRRVYEKTLTPAR